MTAPSLPSEATGDAPERKALLAEIDRSCRTPLMLLFLGALVWLVMASVLGLIASIKLHSPGFLSGCACFSYGRIQPAATNVFLYGFAMQAGLAVALWLLCRLGQTPLCCPGFVTAAKFVWNFGVALGVFGILTGDSTGYEWLEMPRYAAPILFVGYAMIALAAFFTLKNRRGPGLYVSHWFLLAALLAFPWLYSAAEAMLVFQPVRGVMQTIVNGWFIHGLRELFFGGLGLAVIFYFLPKILGHPLHSRHLAIYAFWLMVLCGSWGGVSVGAPLPRWISSLCVVSGMLMLVPLATTATNLHFTISAAGGLEKIKSNNTLKFLVFAAFCYLLSGALNAISGLPGVSALTRFTHFDTAVTWLNLYGFFAMAMFGAIYYIVPRLMQMEFPKAGWVNRHFAVSALGGILYVMPLLFGGLAQGAAMNDPAKPFIDSAKAAMPFIGVSTIGLLLIAVGNVILFVNLAKLLVQCGRECCSCAGFCATEGGTKRAEASR